MLKSQSLVQSSFAPHSSPVANYPSVARSPVTDYRSVSPMIGQVSRMASLPVQSSFSFTNGFTTSGEYPSGTASPLPASRIIRKAGNPSSMPNGYANQVVSTSAGVGTSRANVSPTAARPVTTSCRKPIRCISSSFLLESDRLTASQDTVPPPLPLLLPSSEDKRKERRASVTPSADADLFKRQVSYKETALQHMVFSWMRWAPEPDTPCYKALHEHFPDALPGPALHFRIRSILEGNPYGLKPETTLLGSSVCPDEINNEEGDLIDSMTSVWGNHVFPLGGIGGAPFVGATGFKAFSHHVPDDGDIILVYGPHVGISSEGEIGKCLRAGQGKVSTSCGAVVGAYNACLCNSGKGQSDADDDYDMQMGWIKRQLAPHVARIQNETNPLAALAYQAYEMVNAKLERIVNNDFGSGKLVLIGGIQINLPAPFKGHFLPIKFEVRQKGQPSQDLFGSLKFRTEEPGANGFYNGFPDNLSMGA